MTDIALPNTPNQSYLKIARNCSCLVNVASQMAADWINIGHPDQDHFNWTPKDSCLYTQDLFRQFNFNNVELIWSSYSFTGGRRGAVDEPFGFIVSLDDTAYLIFRGSQTRADFTADTQFGQIDYSGGGKVSRGFWNVFSGLHGLKSKLQAIKSKNLVISGHSLGSTLATLSVPLALECGFNSNQVTAYPQASPKVGDEEFANNFDRLMVKTYRLVNTADSVPKSPPDKVRAKYKHVGIAVTYTANYAKEQLRHHPCCSYAYALRNPNIPVQPNISNPTCFSVDP